MADRLLSNVKSNLGGFYYIPSRNRLAVAPSRSIHVSEAQKPLGCNNFDIPA